MIDIDNPIEMRNRLIDYAFLYNEQREIARGYKELIEEYQKVIKEKDMKISGLMDRLSIARVELGLDNPKK